MCCLDQTIPVTAPQSMAPVNIRKFHRSSEKGSEFSIISSAFNLLSFFFHSRALCYFYLAISIVFFLSLSFSSLFLTITSENPHLRDNNELLQRLRETSACQARVMRWDPFTYYFCFFTCCICKQVRDGLDMMERLFQRQELLAHNFCLKFLVLLLPSLLDRRYCLCP